jgi:hypothetical protein
MVVQSFEPWYPVADIPTHLSGAVALQANYKELLVLCDGAFENGKLLILAFAAVDAFQVQEELVHRWPSEKGLESLPRSPGSSHVFPFLKIVDSEWAAGSVRAVTFGEVATHYCVISWGYIIDVLALHPPQAIWVEHAQYDAFYDALKAFAGPKANL